MGDDWKSNPYKRVSLDNYVIQADIWQHEAA